MVETNVGHDRDRETPRKRRSKNGRKPPKPIRSARMQFEMLEPRAMMAGLISAAESEVLEASCLSAFFEQSSLYDVGQPAAFPTVTWEAHLEQQPHAPLPSESLDLIARASAAIEGELGEIGRNLGPLALPQGVGARAAGGIRRLSRIESGWPAHVFAPYIDLSALPAVDLSELALTEGILYFNLGYVTADDQGQPSWGGDAERAINGGPFDAALREQVAKVRALGGDVAVSFGGPRGKSLAEAITDVDQLKNAYRSVVDAYGLSRVDFDLSNAALDDQAAVERRWQAVSALQREMADAGQPLEVWVTLPATPSGLNNAGLDAVQSAIRNHVGLDGVNLKTTDGSGEVAPKADAKADEKLGRRTIEGAINAFYQLRRSLQPDETAGNAWLKIGITPRVGGDAADGQAFRARDARELMGFARQQGVGMISTWSPNGASHMSSQPAGGAAPANGGVEGSGPLSDIFRGFTELLPR